MIVLLYIIIICSLPLTGIADHTDTGVGSGDGTSLVEVLQGEHLLEVFSRRRRDVQLELDTGSGDEYPSLEPDLGDTTINFTTSFTITNMFMENFDDDRQQNFTTLAHESFQEVVGFTDFKINDIRNGSVHVDVVVELNAGKVNQVAGEQGWEDVTSNLLSACTHFMVVSPEFTIKNDIELWLQHVRTVADGMLELCNSSNARFCGWGSQVTCPEGVLRCFHLCAGEGCGGRGTCTVSGPTEQVAKCRCEDDEWYSYSGLHCEQFDLKWSVVLGITFGVFLLLIGVAVAVAVIWWRKRQKKHKSSLSANNSFTGTYWGSARGLGKQLFKPSFYSDERWSPTYRMFRSDSEWEGTGHTTQGPCPALTPSFQHLDTHTPFSIARPKLA